MLLLYGHCWLPVPRGRFTSHKPVYYRRHHRLQFCHSFPAFFPAKIFISFFPKQIFWLFWLFCFDTVSLTLRVLANPRVRAYLSEILSNMRPPVSVFTRVRVCQSRCVQGAQWQDADVRRCSNYPAGPHVGDVGPLWRPARPGLQPARSVLGRRIVQVRPLGRQDGRSKLRTQTGAAVFVVRQHRPHCQRSTDAYQLVVASSTAVGHLLKVFTLFPSNRFKSGLQQRHLKINRSINPSINQSINQSIFYLPQ